MHANAQDENVAVYVVHLWPECEPPSGFRASVRRVDRDQREFFTHPAALTTYFLRQSRAEPSRLLDRAVAALCRGCRWLRACAGRLIPGAQRIGRQAQGDRNDQQRERSTS